MIRHHAAFGYRESKMMANNKLIKSFNANIIYQDVAPVSLMNERSVKDLNDKIKKEYGDQNEKIVPGNIMN